MKKKSEYHLSKLDTGYRSQRLHGAYNFDDKCDKLSD